MDKRVVRTIYADHLTTHKELGIPYEPLPNSTINQKFNIFPDELPVAGEYPYMRYLAIGRDGSKMSVSTSGDPIPVQKEHSSRDGGMFRYTPFVVRRLEEDLNPTQRARYRMRVPFTSKSGVAYVAYYLLAIDIRHVKPVVELRHVEDGKVTSVEFEPERGDLDPVYKPISNINKNDPNGDCLISTAKIEIILDNNDVQEIIHGFEVIDGDASGARITEFATVNGIDRKKDAVFGTARGTYTEVVCASMHSYIWKYELLNSSTDELKIVLDVGSSEMLLI